MTVVSQYEQPSESVIPECTGRRCRFCDARLERTFIDLGMSPLCETYPSARDLDHGEMYYPLRVYVCTECFLVQLSEYENAETIFADYPYFSSYSDSWLKHAENYCAEMTRRLRLTDRSFVVEVASNDGYLLQYFAKRNVPVLGIEPAGNVARVAVEKGIPTIVRFFGSDLARQLAAEGQQADLLLGNNVLAQVPELNDFVEGLQILLKPQGVLTLEFPHVLRLIEQIQFDTIYHEHFSYFSLITTVRLLKAHNLTVFDVQELPTHGGSLRVFACRANDTSLAASPNVARILETEERAGLKSSAGYEAFRDRARETKHALVEFLLTAAREGKSVAGYGAPGKSATLLHHCGIGKDWIQYTVDRNPYKQGRFLPGTHIPICHPDRIRETRPDYVLILPWNLKDEIMGQLQYIREWGGRFVVPIPRAQVY
jgi:2-polyprenyl-3-methyl-5-hydroxy-6-metoxy-1,4-benzoquinol methylase